ncbi:MAG TPA: efflux RND transporter permease subunit [Myxococcota bacterium]|nr:efflux RND transporter permease subunit [Myxococcota bacterium]
MSPIDLCIERPVLTLMMTLSLVVFGVLGYQRLGVDQFPKMEFPVVMVSARLEGASPEVVESDVTDILEEQLNTIAGVRSLRSTSTQGSSTISVEFQLDRPIDVAAQDVRDKVARARYALPKDVEPPVVDKVNLADQPIMWIPLSTDRPPVAASEFVRQHLKPVFETIPDVGSVVIFGRIDRNIRIWLDGEALRARGLAAGDVLGALGREHVEVPGGLVESKAIDYSVKTDAEFHSVEEMAGLVVAYQDGAPVRLRDVARVEDGAEDSYTLARFDGKPAVGLGLRKQSGGNTVRVSDEAQKRIHALQPTLPAGMSFTEGEGLADFSVAIRESVAETQFALVFGAFLAVLTVWAFLRRTQPTLIIATAIPLSLVGTFGVLWAAGYTLNTMTLLGLALAVGVVVDDAIVVLENVERHREMGETPRVAASRGTKEIAFAATAATVSIAAVFLPVIFVRGLVGNFLSEFGLVVSASVLISLFVALTLTPMLAARMSPPKPRDHGSVYHALERAFAWIESRYVRLLDWSLRHRKTTLGIALASFVVALGFGALLGAEFFPNADQGRIFARIETPPGTSLEATLEFLKKNEAWMLAQPEVVGLFSAVAIGGSNGPGATNQGVMFAMLKSRKQRQRSAQELVHEARKVFGEIAGEKAAVFDMSSMVGSGRGGGDFEVEIQGNLELAELDRLADELVRRLEAKGGFVDLDKSLKLGLPEVRVIPDREKAANLGVDAQSLATTVQAMIGGLDVATFKEAGQRYDVRVRLEEKDRAEPAAIERLYVRGRDGSPIELRNLVRIETGAAASAITRTNRQRSVSISGNLQGKPLADAIADAREIASTILPEGAHLELAGQAEAFREGAQQLVVALLLGVLVIYMVLAAQFESVVHPVTVMLALPLSLIGALGGLLLGKMTLNLFSMIGIILMFGLVTKNSILLVEFANQLRGRGMEKREAMRTAAPIRMRPVLMTAIAMVLGVVPAALGLGPGSETRAPMAVAAGAGMLSSTFLTLIVVPTFYLLLDDLAEAVQGRARRWLGRDAPHEPHEPDRTGLPTHGA